MQKAIYTTVGIDELLPHVQALKGAGARFVQMHAERCVDDGSYRLVYTFINVRAAQEQIARDGSYAIQRPFVLVTREGDALSETAQKFFDYVTSGEAADIIAAAGAVAAN